LVILDARLIALKEEVWERRYINSNS